MRSSFLTLITALFFVTAHAATIEKPLADPVREQQAGTIFHALRCVVCEGQSLAESDAVLAVQMRDHVRTMLAEGKTPDEIYSFFRSSYGDRILMNPPVESTTFALWAAPILLLLIGGIALWRFTRQPKEPTHD